MLASPGPWRPGVAVALWSSSPQTDAALACRGSIRFYSILFHVFCNIETCGPAGLISIFGVGVGLECARAENSVV